MITFLMFNYKAIYITEDKGNNLNDDFLQTFPILLGNLKDVLQANKVKYRNMDTAFYF